MLRRNLLERLKRLEIGRLSSIIPLVSPVTPISKIIGILKELNAYEVFLEVNKKIGIITTRSILRTSKITKAKAKSLAIFVPKLSPKTTLEEAARLMMEHRIRALPIIENNSLIGAIQALSIIKLMKDHGFSGIKAKDIMTRNPITLFRDDLASKARRLMTHRRIDHLPVLIGGELIGVLTSSQIVFNMFQATETIDRNEMLFEQQRKLEFSVKNLMDTNPLACKINDNITLVCDEMIRQEATCSIVTLWKEVQGIITYRDYMKLIAKQLDVTEAPLYIIGLPDNPLEAEMAKSKFTRSIKHLKRIFPFIEEAKAIIRTFSKGKKVRQRYEVRVSIITPKRTFTYTESGWELPEIFDDLTKKMKKTLTQRFSRRTPKKGVFR